MSAPTARDITPPGLRVPIRLTTEACIACHLPIRPGHLYAVLSRGPEHIVCPPIEQERAA